ncbi:MAG: hypothetical protein ACLR2G_09360 [Phascolarctobacterium faecium]
MSVIEATINEMLHEWSIQPVYTSTMLLKGLHLSRSLVGVGGGAAGLIMVLGERMGLPVEIPAGATVANAVGRHWPGRLLAPACGPIVRKGMTRS